MYEWNVEFQVGNWEDHVKIVFKAMNLDVITEGVEKRSPTNELWGSPEFQVWQFRINQGRTLEKEPSKMGVLEVK